MATPWEQGEDNFTCQLVENTAQLSQSYGVHTIVERKLLVTRIIVQCMYLIFSSVVFLLYIEVVSGECAFVR